MTPPAEKKLRSLAKVLECDPDVLLAMAGRLPEDVLKIIQQRPREYMALLRDLRARSAEELNQARKILSVSLPVTPELARLFTKGDVEQYEWAGDRRKLSADEIIRILTGENVVVPDSHQARLAPTGESTVGPSLEPLLDGEKK